ncbi:MAG: TIR domain-containing protein [Lachnospiraceae bacterium]|nr:TIR domain-containing protein [Lachnospiraceae bacterium]
MPIFKCKMCGGTIEFESGATVGECQHCGTKQTLPKLDDDRKANLYDRANHFRRNNDYDKAAGIYEQILNEDPSDAEVYWSLALCQYGIEYVEDPVTHKRVPTVNRAQFTSIFDDDNYKSALQYADTLQQTIYKQEANAINEIQKGILSISQKEDPFDIFICYKETDANGRRTQDSVLANDLYHQLTQEGFKVFFARITLEDKLGTAYEPYIFAALNSAKVMVVLGTKPEYFNAIWVKNEWSRYLGLVKNSNGKKILIPAYKDMDPYDLPEEFSHLQAQDMSKLGFMQDLIRGIKKIVVTDEPKPVVKEVVKEIVKETSTNASVESFLKRVDIFLDDEQWEDANTYCEKVLDIDPENARAYLGKLMAELRVRRLDDLLNCEQPFDNRNNYQKAVRFGDDEIAGMLSGCIDHIKKRNENARLTDIYNNAVAVMKSANSESSYKVVVATFKTISGFEDADSLAEQCLERAEECRRIEEKLQRVEKEKVIRIAETIKAGKISSNDTILKQKLVASKNRIEFLSTLRNEFATLLTQMSGLQKEQMAVVSQKTKLSEELSSLMSQEASLTARLSELGIFAGREKKQIGEELAKIDAKKREINSRFSILDNNICDIANRIRQNKEHRCSFNSKEDIENEITKENVAASKLEEQIEHWQVNRRNSYSYEEAIKIYLKEQEMTRAVNSVLYPTVDCNSILFGRYVQKENDTPEPIEWQVLERKNNRLLVISKYALEFQPYNKINESVTWKNCTLNKWLNEIFLNEAFSEEERAMIPRVPVSSNKNPDYNTNPGKSTTDKVFLLSILEVNNYFGSNDARKCKATAHCYAQDGYKDINKACGWWLRSPGYDTNFAACVLLPGRIDSRGSCVNCSLLGVRPALYIIF